MQITRAVSIRSTDPPEVARAPGVLNEGVSELVLAVLQKVPFGVTIIDRQFRYLYVNSVAAQINGYAEEQHFGRRPQEVVPRVWTLVEPLLKQVFETGKPLPGIELQGETPAHPGENRCWSTSYFPLVHGSEVTAVAAIFNDVTETRQAEAAREESETRFLSFMNNLPGAAWMKDGAGRYVYVNAANHEALRIFTKLRGDSLGMTDAEFLPGETAKQFQESDRRVMEGGSLRTVEALPLDDGVHNYVVAKFPVTGVDGQKYVGGMAVDITDRIKAEEALAEKTRHLEEALAELDAAGKIKDDFLGMVSHELRTPITSILGNASILARMRRTLSEDQQVESIADLLGEAVRLNQIVENLLVLARLQHGVEVDGEPLLVSKTIDRVLKEEKRRSPGREFHFRRLNREPIGFGVEAYVEQVLRNYVSNAVKYSDACSAIEVTLHQSGKEMRVRVLDRGEGLASEDFEHLFQPFYRSARTAQTTSGVGIGLSVCKRLVEAQRGKVWAKARSQGGMEFGFSLPLAGEKETD